MANEAPISEVKLAQQTVAYVTVAGASASASETTIPLEADGQQLDGPMIPVPARCYLERIGVSWFADSNSPGDWSIALYRRRGDTTSLAATLTFSVT